MSLPDLHVLGLIRLGAFPGAPAASPLRLHALDPLHVTAFVVASGTLLHVGFAWSMRRSIEPARIRPFLVGVPVGKSQTKAGRLRDAETNRRGAVYGNSPGSLDGSLQALGDHGTCPNDFWNAPMPAASFDSRNPTPQPYEVIARDAVYWIGERSVARSHPATPGCGGPTRAPRSEIMAGGLESRIVGRVLVQANEVLRKSRLPTDLPVRDILESYVDATGALLRMEAALSEAGRGAGPEHAEQPSTDPVPVFLREAAAVLRALSETLKLAYLDFAHDYAASDPIGARKPVLAAFCDWAARQRAGKRTAQAISRALPRLGVVPAAAERPDVCAQALEEMLDVLIELMERSSVALAADHLRPDLSAPLSIRELAPAERVLEHTRYYVCLEFPGGRYVPFA